MTAAFIKHLPCETCGSSDANALYEDGNQYCHKCETFIPYFLTGGNMKSNTVQRAPIQGVINNIFSTGEYMSLKGRAITEET